MNEHSAEQLKTTLKGSWIAKMAIFFVVLLGLAAWGYVDAEIVYPARGRDVVAYTSLHYLQVSNESNMLYRSSVVDPAAEYARLSESEFETLPVIERTRLSWLTAISRLESLESISAANTVEMARRLDNPSSDPIETATLFASPAKTLAALDAAWANKGLPKALSSFDIPVQWLIFFAGIAGALWVGFLFVKAKTTSFAYKPEAHELILPGGKSFTPEMIEVVDKRKWDKFFVFLKVTGFPGEIKLDLLKFVPLEEWILEMEKLSPNYEPEEEEGTGGEEGSGEAASEEPSEEHAQSA